MSKIKNKKIGIIDYELSNLGAIKSAVKKLNYEYKLIKEPKYLSSVEKIILPGVGSFKTAVENLLKSDLFYAIKDEVLEKKTYFRDMLRNAIVIQHWIRGRRE